MKGFKVINKQYIPMARDKYSEFDTLTEYDQQSILNLLHEEVTRDNPKEASRLRMAQYRQNKRQQSAVLAERIRRLESTCEIIDEDIVKLKRKVRDLEKRLIIPNIFEK